MKPSAVLLSSLASVAIAQGGPEIDAEWTVGPLSASAEPHGTVTTFSLVVSNLTTTATCTGHGNSYQVLGSLPETSCTPSDFAFSWTEAGTGAILEIFNVATNQVAMHNISADQIVWENEQPNPNGRIQVYEGPSNFTVSADVATAN